MEGARIMRERLGVGIDARRAIPGDHRILKGFRGIIRLAVMLGEPRRVVLQLIGIKLFNAVRHPQVNLAPFFHEQRFVRGLLGQRVFEEIRQVFFGRWAHELRVDQICERLVKTFRARSYFLHGATFSRF